MKRVAVAGAGFSGAVIARELAQEGYYVEVFDARDHVAGNCYTERDADTGIQLHRYGPHIFHTNDVEVWHYVKQFGEFSPYVNRVKAVTRGQVFTLPINLHTINQFFGKTFSPKEAENFIHTIAETTIQSPATFEEQALRYVGRELYEAFFKGYTKKQWGIDPHELPASILKRLPLRFNYDDNYFYHRYQGIPRHGYTRLIENILVHPRIRLFLKTRLTPDQVADYDHTFWSGPMDAFFAYRYGRLPYRTLDFERIVDEGDFQGNAVVNYCEETVPFTRVCEHKYFTPWEMHESTIAYREYSRPCDAKDIPYYPIRLNVGHAVLQLYEQNRQHIDNVTFVGRLGTFRYLDMDVTVREALDAARRYVATSCKAS